MIKQFIGRLICMICPYQFKDVDRCHFRRFVFHAKK